MQFIEQINNHHPRSNLQLKLPSNYIPGSYQNLKYKPTRCSNVQIAYLTHQELKKGCFKGEALRMNSCNEIFKEKIENFKSHLLKNGLSLK